MHVYVQSYLLTFDNRVYHMFIERIQREREREKEREKERERERHGVNLPVA